MASKLTIILIVLLVIAVGLYFYANQPPRIIKSKIQILYSPNNWTIEKNLSFTYYRGFGYTFFNLTFKKNLTIPTIPFDSPLNAIYPLLEVISIFSSSGTLEVLTQNQSVLIIAEINYNSTRFINVSLSILPYSNVTINGTYNGFIYYYSNNEYELENSLYGESIYPESGIVLIKGDQAYVIETSGFFSSIQSLLQIFSHLENVTYTVETTEINH
ncbi:hypothetical protein [Sulfurisphaera ohwakuensis]|uniref:Uncharacterized protein n=1 Tax=Sulfurisphaera ohwakuensis TaxID=69656 RepID=A0A650CHL7_SULOH|nr:hypothetical protein [Sulfurisphaera ohwakuensis]MBB5254799.1 hypothetical protein [Sulfurisphaera ohwakuensis]QGR17292.1 hypothetical protein D1869_08885 [Sulfurisphaera ohwakuensis]